MKANSNAFLVLTPGDPEGIGPEITWKAIQSLYQERASQKGDSKKKLKIPSILCVGARAPFEALGAPIREWNPLKNFEISPNSQRPEIWLWPAPTQTTKKQFLPGFQAGWSIEKATHLVLNGVASALVTGPISKDRLQKGGYLYPGHTEFLAELCKKSQKPLEVTMMLTNEFLRVTLVTTHVALKDVSRVLTRQKIRRAILQTQSSLVSHWGIQRPRIAVTALNPHAGENGLFGSEEIDLIEPELKSLRKNKAIEMTLEGPLPADTLFAKQKLAAQQERYDAVVCMYHDQGLIPVKLLDFHNTVNVTLGLPIIRTSVDHGVGFDIAGKGIADPSSLKAAIRLATELAQVQASQGRQNSLSHLSHQSQRKRRKKI